MSEVLSTILGVLMIGGVATLAAYGVLRGRRTPPSGARHEDWFRQMLGNPRMPGDGEFPKDRDEPR